MASMGASTSTSPGTAVAEGQCISRMPGEILTADEAVVRFSTTRVCVAYVTIKPGTPVTFKNEDSVAHTISITETDLTTGAPVADGVAGPGLTWVRTFDTEGVFSFVTDAIPSFHGTVEVTTG